MTILAYVQMTTTKIQVHIFIIGHIASDNLTFYNETGKYIYHLPWRLLIQYFVHKDRVPTGFQIQQLLISFLLVFISGDFETEMRGVSLATGTYL
jgi:hypothetical protein